MIIWQEGLYDKSKFYWHWTIICTWKEREVYFWECGSIPGLSGHHHHQLLYNPWCNVPQAALCVLVSAHRTDRNSNQITVSLTGSASRDTQPLFFHDSNPSWPLINRLRYFQIQFRFCRDTWSQSCLRGVLHTAETKKDTQYIKILYFISFLSW